MIVTKLKITNLRPIETAEFQFKPGFNLIFGINGVGKTSVLNALSVCLSAVVKQVNKLHNPVEAFTDNDIRIGSRMLTVECGVRFNNHDYVYLVHKPRESSAVQKKKTGMPREQSIDTPELSQYIGDIPSLATGKEKGGRPLAVLFLTSRAVPSERAPGKYVSEGKVAGAFGDTFASRELRLGEFADWMSVQLALCRESPEKKRKLDAVEEAVTRFLPGYKNLHLGSDTGKKLLIDHDGKEIAVRDLSDGERGVLALVLDLTRRLAQANPDMQDPAAEAEAIVLIDEIELHLHPQWQRDIIRNLSKAFPRCQFIATTHSPQIIGEVEHEQIQYFSKGGVYSPPYSYGIDSSRVLEEIMNSDQRTSDVKELLSKISELIGKHKFDLARERLKELKTMLRREDDPMITRLETLLGFLEGKD